MKIKHLFGLAVIAAMTASCSSNEDLGTAGPGTGTNEAGASYASITIDLPTTRGTRAKIDNFDGGTASEYAVNDATLLIFKKGTETSENNFKFVEAVPLGNLEPWKKDKTDDNGITTEATITAELQQVTVGEGGDYYALVILNNKDKDNKDKVSMPVSTTSFTDTYGTWNAAATVKNLIDYKKGFYMANAPEFKGADKEPTTLVQIKGIYRTKEEAHSKPGATVHVERGLAKVTVGSSSTSSTSNYFATAGANATGNKYKSDNVKITSWALDVINKYSFPVHVTAGLKDGLTSTSQTIPSYPEIWSNIARKTDRFVSQVSATGAFKRIYWGIDPNYSMNDLSDLAKCGEQFTLAAADGSPVTWKNGSGSDNPLYCLENTFDIKNMKQGQTTRVLLKATYTPSVLSSPLVTDKTFFMIGNSSDIWTTETLKAQIASKAEEVLSTITGVTVTGVKVTLKGKLLEGGTHVLDATNVEIKSGEDDKTADVVDKINTKLGFDLSKGVGIKTYKNGESYYIARIKHFGDDFTKWNPGELYGTDNEKYLGRYGVLRNNWYDLTVNSISGPGYPDVPKVKPDTPDDEDTKYINVCVKILDWAKRSQNVEL